MIALKYKELLNTFIKFNGNNGNKNQFKDHLAFTKDDYYKVNKITENYIKIFDDASMGIYFSIEEFDNLFDIVDNFMILDFDHKIQDLAKKVDDKQINCNNYQLELIKNHLIKRYSDKIIKILDNKPLNEILDLFNGETILTIDNLF